MREGEANKKVWDIPSKILESFLKDHKLEDQGKKWRPVSINNELKLMPIKYMVQSLLILCELKLHRSHVF